MGKTICLRCLHGLCAAKVPIFSELKDTELRKIVQLTGQREYKKGETLVREGTVSDTLFILNKGMVKLSKFNSEGKEQILRVLRDGDFFGELSIFSDIQTSNFTAYAIRDTKICTLSRGKMNIIIKENPGITLKILESLSRRIASTENLAQHLSAGNADSRTAFVLLELSEKYGVAGSGGTTLKLPLNREELASYAGLTRETLSRKLSGFEKKGVIKTLGNKSILLIDPDFLEDSV
ncbi:MAG: Crp/Fnr family transcriptional regulator [Spirochaetales bacterium]|nr:Crp/Fnr family transcriptional regulator [Spirochaetales bacterium]